MSNANKIIQTNRLTCNVDRFTGLLMSNFFSFSSLFSGLSFKVFFKLYPRKSSVQKQSMEVFCKKGFLKNFARFTKKHLCWRPFGILKLILQILKFGIYMRVSENLKVFVLKNFNWKTKINTIQSKSFCCATFKKLMIQSFSFYIFFTSICSCFGNYGIGQKLLQIAVVYFIMNFVEIKNILVLTLNTFLLAQELYSG